MDRSQPPPRRRPQQQQSATEEPAESDPPHGPTPPTTKTELSALRRRVARLERALKRQEEAAATRQEEQPGEEEQQLAAADPLSRASGYVLVLDDREALMLMGSTDRSCAVCLSDRWEHAPAVLKSRPRPGDQAAYALCRHVYCLLCLLDLVLRGDTKCPMCRRDARFE